MAKRKANKEGSIVKRSDGRYMGRYTLNGKRLAVYGATFEEVRVRLTEILSKIDRGERVGQSNMTFSKWLREWLVAYALPTVKQSSYISYESYVRLHLEPMLGKTKLSALNVETMQRFFNHKYKGDDGNKPLSPKSLRNIYNMLHNCLDQAVINGHLSINPVDGVKLPTAPHREMPILTLEEQAALQYASLNSDTLAAFGIIFTVSTGLRFGEMLGLQWDDVDYTNHTIKIKRTVGRLQKVDESGRLVSREDGGTTTEIVSRAPKSKNSKRTIPLFPKVWEDLMAYRERQREMLGENGVMMLSTTPVFSTPTGLVSEPRTYEDLFKRTLKEANVSDINFHALRHTFATRALEAGMDIKVLSSILGHAQASTTLNFYAHALPDHKKLSMEKMAVYYEGSLASE